MPSDSQQPLVRCSDVMSSACASPQRSVPNDVAKFEFKVHVEEACLWTPHGCVTYQYWKFGCERVKSAPVSANQWQTTFHLFALNLFGCELGWGCISIITSNVRYFWHSVFQMHIPTREFLSLVKYPSLFYQLNSREMHFHRGAATEINGAKMQILVKT